MAFEYNDQKKETGVDVDLELPGGDTIPVTNVSFSEEAETSEVQFNNSYSQDLAVTGVSYSGSFEVAGRNNSLRSTLWGGSAGNEDLDTVLPTYLGSMTVVDGAGTAYVFTNVLITSHSKDAPADDRTTESYDFSAEKLVIEESSSSGDSGSTTTIDTSSFP
jgi:hypothetical protein